MMWLRLIALGVLSLLASGCRPAPDTRMSLEFSTYSQSPVVINAFIINDKIVLGHDLVVQGTHDIDRANDFAGVQLLTIPGGEKEGLLHVQARWVELLSSHAYNASLDLPVSELTQGSDGSRNLMVVFGPGGLLLATSDHYRTGEADHEPRDIARLCGSRSHADDRDYTVQPDALAGLRETLDYDRPLGELSGCEDKER